MLDFLGNLVSAGVNWFSGNAQRESSERMAQQNIALQREFAQNGIQWKVADARAAGIHPQFALGANTVSYAPVSLGDSGSEHFSRAGQDIGRAIAATSTKEGRDSNFQAVANKLALEKGGLENELLRTQISRIKQQIGPSVPSADAPALIPGQSIVGGELRRGDPGDAEKAAPGPEHVGYKFGGVVETNPAFSDAQKFEDRYGEPGEWLAGGVNLIGDPLYTVSRSPWFQEFARYVDYLRHGRRRATFNERFTGRR